MSLITCPECKSEVSDTAKSCPKCGYDLLKAKKKQDKKYKRTGYLTIIAIILVFIGIKQIVSLFKDEPKSDKIENTRSSSTNSFLAYNYAEKFVKERLKSPSTAKFPKTTEKNKHISPYGTNSYKIKSWVDSQNGFGATIRTNFSCTITFDGNEVKCENLIIE